MFIVGINETPMCDKLYNDRTRRQYLRDCNRYFVPWARDCHPEIMLLSEFYDPKYAVEYVDYLKSFSWSDDTVCTYYAAAAKACRWSRLDVRNLPERRRCNIKKNRNGISERWYTGIYAQLTFLCEHTGIRRKDLKHVLGTDICKRRGVWYVHLTRSKGGKKYYSEVLGTDEDIKRIVTIFKQAGREKVLPTIFEGNKIKSTFPAHALRAVYAAACYKKAAGITGKAAIDHAVSLPREKRYDCRKEFKDIKLNRAALLYTTHRLGHSAPGQTASHYLYSLYAEMREDEKTREHSQSDIEASQNSSR